MLRPKNYYFLIPVIGAIPWGGMLIAMLSAWSLQGHPIYWFVKDRHQHPVYISHIGATNLQPLFISCSSWQALLYVITLITEYFLRKTGRLQFWFKKDERNLLFAAIILGGIGQIGIIMVSIFNTKNFHTVHSTMLGIFVVFVFLSMCCVIVQYFLMGRHYRTIHVNHKYWNKFTISCCLKLVWVICEAVFAICFVSLSDDSTSAIFEWTLAFLYLALFVIFSWDLFQSAKRTHKNFPYIKDWNNRGYYLYDKYFGDSGNNGAIKELSKVHESGSAERDSQTLVNRPDYSSGAEAEGPPVVSLTDEQLQEYPLNNRQDEYPIPHGQKIPTYPVAES